MVIIWGGMIVIVCVVVVKVIFVFIYLMIVVLFYVIVWYSISSICVVDCSCVYVLCSNKCVCCSK